MFQISSIPEKLLLIVLILVNTAFILAGIGVLSVGVHRSWSSSNSNKLEDFEALLKDGTLYIVSGSLDILVGVTGLIGTIFRLRWMLNATVGILALAILGNIFIIIACPVVSNSMIYHVSGVMKDNILAHYGNTTNKESSAFTENLDNHQKKHSCCGWSDNPSDNIYLKTAWYTLVNVNRTSGSDSSPPVTLPDSCCQAGEDSCTKATNLVEARDKGAVYKIDCMTKMSDRTRKFVVGTMAHVAFGLVIQIGLCILNVLRLRQTSNAPGTEPPPPVGD